MPEIKTPKAAATPSLQDVVTDLAAKQEKLAGRLNELLADDGVRRTPFARKGENALTSRGYSYTKLFQLMGKRIGREDAKVEADYHDRLQKHCFERFGFVKSEANSILAPFASEFLPIESDSDAQFVREVRDVVRAGVAGADRGELAAIRKTLSWTDESQGGALIPPPMQGELIEVLRNNEVFMKAGAQTVGLPANGRMVYPRQTGASTAYHVGESQPITASNPTTGDLTLSAKKLACLVKAPNELFRYSSISVESFLRDDMMKVMGLLMDLTLLQGVGSSVAPKGLINYAGIGTYTSTGTPADGNSGYPLQPEDIPGMISVVEEANAQFKTMVMRPSLWAALINRRADAVTANDRKGPFMFNLIRTIGENFGLGRETDSLLYGYPVHKSTQISNTRTRGSGATMTYILGGDFSDYLVALSPVIEFALNQQAETPFVNDQTWLRAILPYDAAPKREASFVLCDALLTS